MSPPSLKKNEIFDIRNRFILCQLCFFWYGFETDYYPVELNRFSAKLNRQFSTNTIIKIIKLTPVLLTQAFVSWVLGANKTCINTIIFHLLYSRKTVYYPMNYKYLITCKIYLCVEGPAPAYSARSTSTNPILRKFLPPFSSFLIIENFRKLDRYLMTALK